LPTTPSSEGCKSLVDSRIPESSHLTDSANTIGERDGFLELLTLMSSENLPDDIENSR
jgi:hypothetical protein